MNTELIDLLNTIVANWEVNQNTKYYLDALHQTSERQEGVLPSNFMRDSYAESIRALDMNTAREFMSNLSKKLGEFSNGAFVINAMFDCSPSCKGKGYACETDDRCKYWQLFVQPANIYLA